MLIYMNETSVFDVSVEALQLIHHKGASAGVPGTR